jgi:hypothetical protein
MCSQDGEVLHLGLLAVPGQRVEGVGDCKAGMSGVPSHGNGRTHPTRDWVHRG